MFTWEKNDLNLEQEAAIKEEESVLLIACPGSGKTRTLTYKIAYELNNISSSKEFIIALTYTNTAADEIKERVELLGVDTNQLWIGTIHAFCLEWILRPYCLYINKLKNGFRIINSHDSESILTELCEPYKKHKIKYWDCGILATTDGIVLTCLDENKHVCLNEIIAKYYKILEDNGQIDFEQIIYYAHQILIGKPVVCSILSKLFKFVLIDEYQDTKEIQYHIISKILKEGQGKSKILIVGDPNQSIYESLGGFPMEKEDIEKLLGFNLKLMGLTKNYRSSESIINYFDYYKTFKTTIKAEGKNQYYPSEITFNDNISKDNLVDELVKLINYNLFEKHISQNEICIVAPRWIHLASVTRSLMARLPDCNFDGPGMAPFSRDYDNFWFKLSRIVLTEPSPYMYIRRLRWSKEVLSELESAGVCILNLTNKNFLKICNSIIIDEEDGIKYLELFFELICKEINIEISLYPTLQEHFESFFQSSKKRIDKLQNEGNQSISSIKSFKKIYKQKSGITVSTVHGVKGEEYDTVIGFAILDSYIPHFNDLNGEVNSKKILYVLSSRARKNLHIISETGRNVHEYYRPNGFRPTSHLLEYEFNYSELELE